MLNNPKGTRDFNAVEIRNREKILSIIISIFKRYGFEPIQTPAMEYTETLMGKYGNEGEKLIYRILDSGDVFQKAKEAKSNQQLQNLLAQKALRYDQTIPLFRYIHTNFHTITFPFRRYQQQLVWRADRPQKGRFREFLQCDADIIGSKSLLSEIDLLIIYHHVFLELGLTEYTLQTNHRYIFKALKDSLRDKDAIDNIVTEFDKVDKIGYNAVVENLSNKGLPSEDISLCKHFLSFVEKPFEEINEAFDNIFKDNESYILAKNDLNDIFNHSVIKQNHVNIVWNPSLARGLDYYTGVIFEAIVNHANVGSVGGGGRYDCLISSPDKGEYLPCVGLSFGVDRLYEILKTVDDFFLKDYQVADVLFFNLGKDELNQVCFISEQVRKVGVRVVINDKQEKFYKQFKYAERKKIPYVCIVGSQELEKREAKVKELSTGKQESVKFDLLPQYFSSKIKTS